MMLTGELLEEIRQLKTQSDIEDLVITEFKSYVQYFQEHGYDVDLRTGLGERPNGVTDLVHYVEFMAVHCFYWQIKGEPENALSEGYMLQALSQVFSSIYREAKSI